MTTLIVGYYIPSSVDLQSTTLQSIASPPIASTYIQNKAYQLFRIPTQDFVPIIYYKNIRTVDDVTFFGIEQVSVTSKIGNLLFTRAGASINSLVVGNTYNFNVLFADGIYAGANSVTISVGNDGLRTVQCTIDV